MKYLLATTTKEISLSINTDNFAPPVQRFSITCISLLTCQALKFSGGSTQFPHGDGQWIHRHQQGHDLGMRIGYLTKQAALKCPVPLLRNIHTRIWNGSITKAMRLATLYLITPWAQEFYIGSNNTQQAEAQVDNCYRRKWLLKQPCYFSLL